MASRNKKDENTMAEPQQKATPVEPPVPLDGPKQITPMSFFNDPRMEKNPGIKNFAPQAAEVPSGEAHEA